MKTIGSDMLAAISVDTVALHAATIHAVAINMAIQTHKLGRLVALSHDFKQRHDASERFSDKFEDELAVGGVGGGEGEQFLPVVEFAFFAIGGLEHYDEEGDCCQRVLGRGKLARRYGEEKFLSEVRVWEEFIFVYGEDMG
ncbi:MAG: hypothetical protein Q9184_007090 [Pyrenodesmia sp. 2 TL-2023]